jgi:predicted enzyme related to lactoylglutathione lyase
LSAGTAPRRIDRTTSQPRLTMTLRWYSTVIDATGPHRLAAFWADALGWETAAPTRTRWRSRRRTIPTIAFRRCCSCATTTPSPHQNRLHLDLNPDDQENEVQRLLDLGARRTDIRQRNVTWIVLADPEGNEFCVVLPQTT